MNRNNDEADFVMLTCFDKLADFAEKYLTKGMKILVEGHIQTSSWDDKDDVRHWRTDIIVDRHEFCEKKDK